MAHIAEVAGAKGKLGLGKPTADAVGGDLCSQQVSLCNKRWATHKRAEFLTFLQADAETLPFEEQAFDIVINVESSHCYPSFPKFLAEVGRVLKSGGIFAMVDFRSIPV